MSKSSNTKARSDSGNEPPGKNRFDLDLTPFENFTAVTLIKIASIGYEELSKTLAVMREISKSLDEKDEEMNIDENVILELKQMCSLWSKMKYIVKFKPSTKKKSEQEPTKKPIPTKQDIRDTSVQKKRQEQEKTSKTKSDAQKSTKETPVPTSKLVKKNQAKKNNDKKKNSDLRTSDPKKSKRDADSLSLSISSDDESSISSSVDTQEEEEEEEEPRKSKKRKRPDNERLEGPGNYSQSGNSSKKAMKLDHGESPGSKEKGQDSIEEENNKQKDPAKKSPDEKEHFVRLPNNFFFYFSQDFMIEVVKNINQSGSHGSETEEGKSDTDKV